MLSRSEPSINSPFNEFVGLLDQIIGVPIAAVNTMVVEKASTDKPNQKIDLSRITGKITGIRVSKSLIRQLIYKGEVYILQDKLLPYLSVI